MRRIVVPGKFTYLAREIVVLFLIQKVSCLSRGLPEDFNIPSVARWAAASLANA
jgi:hypothetical protein